MLFGAVLMFRLRPIRDPTETLGGAWKMRIPLTLTPPLPMNPSLPAALVHAGLGGNTVYGQLWSLWLHSSTLDGARSGD